MTDTDIHQVAVLLTGEAVAETIPHTEVAVQVADTEPQAVQAGQVKVPAQQGILAEQDTALLQQRLRQTRHHQRAVPPEVHITQAEVHLQEAVTGTVVTTEEAEAVMAEVVPEDVVMVAAVMEAEVLPAVIAAAADIKNDYEYEKEIYFCADSSFIRHYGNGTIIHKL